MSDCCSIQSLCKCVKTAPNYYNFVIIRRSSFGFVNLWKTIVVHKCMKMSVEILWTTVDNVTNIWKNPVFYEKTECG